MDLSGANELYLLERSRVPLVLVPDSTGIPSVLHPQPILYRAAYLSAVDLETGLLRAATQLGNDNCPLFASIPCPDGPPNRSALLFTYQQAVNGMSWIDGTQSFHGARMLQFKPTTTQGPWQWLSEMRAGQAGYFLTGSGGDASLWRVFRLEADAFHRAIFTLTPVRLLAGCPRVDFSSVSDPLLRAELAAQYNDLCNSVASHSYRDVVTKARNITEGVVHSRLRDAGRPTTRDLFGDLQSVKRLLEDDKQRDTSGWGQLEYHLAHKIRLVHGHTHPTQTAKVGRVLRPEFALSVVEDLIELLTIWGYVA